MQWFRLLPFGPSMNTRTFLHNSDPRAKLIFAATYLSLVTLSNDLSGMVFNGIAAIALVLVSRLPFAYLWNSLKGLLPLLLAVVFYHLLLGNMKNAVNVPCKLVFFIVTVAVLSSTTALIKLAEGLEAIMRPLNVIGFPVRDFVFMTTVAFRFIPLFIDEADSMLKALKLNNARNKGGGLRTNIQFLPRLLVALFVAAFRRAEQLALAMDSRCYSSGSKMPASRLHFIWRDWMIVISALVLLLIHVLLKGAVVER